MSDVTVTQMACNPLTAGARLSQLPALLASLPRLSAAEAGDFADDLGAARAPRPRGLG